MAKKYASGQSLARFIAEQEEQQRLNNRANAAFASSSMANSRAVMEPLTEGPFASKTESLLYGLLFGGQAMPADVGFQTVEITGDEPVGLTPPAGAKMAVIVCELGSGTASDQTRLLRWLQTGADPTTTSGFPLGHLGQFQLLGKTHLGRARFLSLYPSATIRLHVEYRY